MVVVSSRTFAYACAFQFQLVLLCAIDADRSGSFEPSVGTLVRVLRSYSQTRLILVLTLFFVVLFFIAFVEVVLFDVVEEAKEARSNFPVRLTFVRSALISIGIVHLLFSFVSGTQSIEGVAIFRLIGRPQILGIKREIQTHILLLGNASICLSSEVLCIAGRLEHLGHLFLLLFWLGLAPNQLALASCPRRYDCIAMDHRALKILRDFTLTCTIGPLVFLFLKSFLQ